MRNKEPTISFEAIPDQKSGSTQSDPEEIEWFSGQPVQEFQKWIVVFVWIRGLVFFGSALRMASNHQLQ